MAIFEYYGQINNVKSILSTSLILCLKIHIFQIKAVVLFFKKYVIPKSTNLKSFASQSFLSKRFHSNPLRQPTLSLTCPLQTQSIGVLRKLPKETDKSLRVALSAININLPLLFLSLNNIANIQSKFIKT